MFYYLNLPSVGQGRPPSAPVLELPVARSPPVGDAKLELTMTEVQTLRRKGDGLLGRTPFF